ncbi:uncharacterized protein STEHIDRAFT_133891 [Stereum hirsutum FP-91666 SS1]|uniref:uncharacterized protein n=1 Tax=Stereum hirsutum (strain FP-91666) TaxID=721885 RepID=UPI0004449FF3|nr:uncharacterized protein STEHIDRAFT_133891 [Stereum hirsutum FP-91666 SS1]EIM82203.1 hypothetical protein STEHIDRAFT_133891 [Stereum hirsutum FP-91666 SS1]
MCINTSRSATQARAWTHMPPASRTPVGHFRSTAKGRSTACFPSIAIVFRSSIGSSDIGEPRIEISAFTLVAL